MIYKSLLIFRRQGGISMMGFIYQIECLPTHESYIGLTVDIKRRKADHYSALRKNRHENPKLQNAWNKYGEQEFHFRYWEFEIKSPDDLKPLECEYIQKYDSLNNGFNLVPGGGAPPLHQKVLNEDIVKFLCVQWKYGDGYGKTCEEIFGWSKGTASAAKRKIRFTDANITFENMSDEEREKVAIETYNKYELVKRALSRQLVQGGCEQAYQLTQDDYNFAYAAQELGYTYTQVANYLKIKPATVKDWFNGRSRKKNKEIYLSLSQEDKNQFLGRVKTAELSGNPKLESSN